MKRRAFFSALIGSSAAAVALQQSSIGGLECVGDDLRINFSLCALEARKLLGDTRIPEGEIFTDSVLRPFTMKAINYKAKDFVAGTAAMAAWSRHMYQTGDRWAIVAGIMPRLQCVEVGPDNYA